MAEDLLTASSVLSDGSGKLPGLDLGPIATGVGALLGPEAGDVSQALEQGVAQALNIDLGAVLSAGWGRALAVQTAITETRRAAGTSAIVPLAPHKITSTHEPRLKLNKDGAQLGEVAFAFDLSADLKGVELLIENGAIQEVRGGSALVEGVLRLKDTVVMRSASKSFALPRKLVLSKQPPTTA